MKSKNVCDERVYYESNKVFRISFWILCAGIFADLCWKFNVYTFDSAKYMAGMITEGAILVVAALFNLFAAAAKGIPPYGNEVEKFSKARYALIAACVAVATTCGMWLPRFCIFGWEYNVLTGILFVGAILLVTAAAIFGLVFLLLYLAFRLARKKAFAIYGD